MLEVRIDIIPFGLGIPEEIAHIAIANRGPCSDHPDERLYHIWLDRRSEHVEVRHFRKDGALKLVQKALSVLNQQQEEPHA